MFGGSFDPPHSGHAQVTREALKRLGLDQLWWLVSPGNPLKSRQPASLSVRRAMAQRLIRDPRVRITEIEARLGTRATVDTLAALKRHYPGVRFVWVMGADNLAQLHRWKHWRRLVGQVPLAVLARPGQRLPALTSPAARSLAGARLPAGAARSLATTAPPAWIWLDIPMRDISSTCLRQSADMSKP